MVSTLLISFLLIILSSYSLYFDAITFLLCDSQSNKIFIFLIWSSTFTVITAIILSITPGSEFVEPAPLAACAKLVIDTKREQRLKEQAQREAEEKRRINEEKEKRDTDLSKQQ